MIMYFGVCFVIILMVDGVYKTAAIVDKVAADLGFRAYKVR